MGSRLFAILEALGGVALLAAACAPASGPTPVVPATSQSPTTTPSGVGDAKETPSPQASQPAKPAQPDTKASLKTSVSGIPLDPNAKVGGVLLTAVTQEGPSFSAWEEAAGIAFSVDHKLLNQLVRNRTWGTQEDFKNTAFFEIHPDLAKSWEQSPDGLRWTFKLRDGVQWSDGKPVTCADTKWSLDTIRTGTGLKRSPRAMHFRVIEGIECTDDLTMVIKLKYPKPGLLEAVGMPYNVIFPKHAYEKNTDPMRTSPPSPTTGPFVLKERVAGEKYLFDRNASYWDKPFPYLDGVEVRIVSMAAIATSLRAGRVDIGSPYGYTSGAAEVLSKECKDCQFWPRMVASSNTPSVMLNHTRKPWNHPDVKDAVSLALDREKHVKVVYQGWAVVPSGCGFYPTGPWAMPAEQCRQIPGYNFNDPEGNKKKAKELLARAGYKPGELKVKVAIWTTLQGDSPSIIEDLRAVGIEAEPMLLETGRAFATWGSGDFDIGVHGFFISGLDPDVLLYEQFYTGSDRNYNRYSNPRFDALVDEMSRTIDPEARKRKAWEAMEIALRDQAKIILSHETYMPVYTPRVRGFMPALNYLSAYGPLLRFEHTWLAEK